MALTFHNADVKFTLKHKRELKEFIRHQIVKSSNHQTIKLTFIFCSDEYLLNINRQFLNHDYYTDIITFPLSSDKKVLEAEIYISVERVKENAEKFNSREPKVKNQENTSFVAEIQRVMFHGVLHLLGYKDKTKAQKQEMRKAEDLWLKQFQKFQNK